MKTIAGQPLSPRRDCASEFIAASGAKPTDNILIAGAGNLDLLIEFIQRGFSHAACQSDRGPHITAQPADILIAANLKTASDFHCVMTLLARDLSPHGALILSCAPSFSEWDLRRLLKQKGFRAVRRIDGRNSAAAIFCARREAAFVARAA